MPKPYRLFSFGLIVSSMVLAPITTLAASFDYDRLSLFSARPIESDSVLSFFGDVSNNEGYTLVNNIDPTAFDSGHVSIAQNALPGGAGYYTMGRDASPDPNTAGERSATLESIDGFPNLTNYLQDNNIPLNSIGYSYGQKVNRDFTQTINLGEDLLGQDWLATPDSPIEERIYQANPDDYNGFLTLGNTPIIIFDYSPTYFAVDNGETLDFTDNTNVFLSDARPAFKADGLNSLESGLADAFLEDMFAAGGLIQEVSEDVLRPDQVQTSFVEIGDETYDITYIGFPVTIRAVGETASVPESSSTLALMLLTGCGVSTYLKQQKKKDRSSHLQ